jgi:hypothetical protein
MDEENRSIIWTKSGCIRCDDFKNAGLYSKIEGLIEYSLEDAEGLIQALWYSMWGRNGVETPCLYIGKNLDEEGTHYRVVDENNKRVYGEDVKTYLESL